MHIMDEPTCKKGKWWVFTFSEQGRENEGMNRPHKTFMQSVGGQIESTSDDGVFKRYNSIRGIWPQNPVQDTVKRRCPKK